MRSTPTSRRISTLNRRSWKRGLGILFGGTAVFVFLTLIFFIKRIEGYSQRAAIEFFESKKDEDCYVISHGYKTYAHLFYGRKQPVEKEIEMGDKEAWKNWCLNGPVDKDVYVITKIHRVPELIPNEELIEVYNKNGFVVFKREKQE